MNQFLDRRVIDDSWDFTSSNTKEYTHCYHIYPAMMIPQVARRLLAEYKPDSATILFDPYCGTGTSLLEGNLIGLHNIGTDLNPLARLITKAKNTLFNINKIKDTIQEFEDIFFTETINGLNFNNFPDFSNIDFWFNFEAKQKLSFISDFINKIDEDIKEYFLIPFSETIREASFTRNSEFKLFRIPEDKMSKHNPDVFGIFISKCRRNLFGLEELLSQINKTDTQIYDFNTCTEIPTNLFSNGVDIIVTSPPYGDSRTTVAYGQFSRLTNQWLGVKDANQVDNNLMGGRNNIDHIELNIESVKEDLNYIKEIDNTRYKDVKSFLIDYKKSIDNISKLMNKNGVICYVVGNRRVKNRQIQLDVITAELFTNNGFEHLKTIVRNIPNKRMPSKNSPSNITGELSATMTNEYIVILKKIN